MTWSELFFSSGKEPGFSGGGGLSFYDLVKKCSLLWYRARIFRYFGDPAETRTPPQLSPPPGGGGGTQVQRGAAPALRISRKKGSFLRPPHVRDFVKEGFLCIPRYEVYMGLKIPLQSTK